MKNLIVYYSLDGNTEWTAQQIAEQLGADLLCLKPVKAYPTGKYSKLVWGGKSVVFAEKPALQPYEVQLSEYDRIIFGSPVWASSVAPPLRTFISDNDLTGKRFAAFFCETANGHKKALIKLKELLCAERMDAALVLLDPKIKPDPQNEQKIADFCAKLQ